VIDAAMFSRSIAAGLPAEHTSRTYRFVKRSLDLAAALALLPVLGALLLALWPIYRCTDPGPLFFRQLRTGRDGRRFRMFKLRTMVVDAEALKLRYAAHNEHVWPDFKMKNDPRVTKLGRVLRKTSLDELPQILNVLSGDMTLVGPRPTSFAPAQYQGWHGERLDVTPGITGLSQVLERDEADFDRRVRLDVAYVRNQSLALDLRILFATVASVLQRRNAH
jgi:lipopolysaccharide/colanic/teichoic acid biosynthesis glycosyltransferase